MKKNQAYQFTIALLAILFSISFTSCAVQVASPSNNASVKSKPLPPGQAKKVTGEKSAKKYAPGHNK